MRKRIGTALVAAGLFSGLAVIPAFAQDQSTMSDGKMAGGKVSHQQMMDKMNSMSADDKAAMFDKMAPKDQMSAMKMSGHDMGKMSHQEMMDSMSKMSAQDKAAAFDKMPTSKKMAAMKMSQGTMAH
jgi:hypothetical protein